MIDRLLEKWFDNKMANLNDKKYKAFIQWQNTRRKYLISKRKDLKEVEK